MKKRDTTAGIPEETERAHRPIRERLPDYATAIALGDSARAAYPEIAAHLAGCAACRAALDELLELTVPAYTGAVETAPAYPRADLSFLRPPAVAPAAARERTRPWLIDEAGRLVVIFSQALLDALRQPTLAGATRGRLLYHYVQEQGAPADVEVTIEIFAEDAAREAGRVRVCVELPGRDPLDQAGSLVVLRAGDFARHGETDETSQIDFAPVPLALLPDLRVEITPQV